MTKSQEIMKAHHKQSLLNFPGSLKDGEQSLWMTPAFEARDPNSSKDYGIGGVKVLFAKRKGDVIIDCSFHTDWYPVPVQERSMSDYRRTDVIGLQPLCAGTYTHRMTKPADDQLEWMHYSKDCALTGGECWGEAGSALYGDTIRDRLINEGSIAVFAELDQFLKEETDAEKD